MRCALDNTFLTLLHNPKASVPEKFLGDHSASDVPMLIESMIADFDDSSATIIIPTPVLAEVMVGTSDRIAVLNRLKLYSNIEIVPFCENSAIELAIISDEEYKNGRKTGTLNEPYQKTKIDRQIVATAKVYGATHFYSTDRQQIQFANTVSNLTVRTISDLRKRAFQTAFL